MDIYTVDWRLSPGFEWERFDRVFSTMREAQRFVDLILPQFMRDEEIPLNSRINKTKVFKMPYWTTLNPYIVLFEEGEMKRITKLATNEMLLKKLIFADGKYGLEICFWDAGDLEQAKVLAQSMHDGWTYAKEHEQD